MKEQFDKKLTDKIKASFESHQEEYDPKEWEKLSVAYFGKPKGAAFPSWAYWAASLAALLLVTSVLVFNSLDTSQDSHVTTEQIKTEEETLEDNIVNQQKSISDSLLEEKSIASSEKPTRELPRARSIQKTTSEKTRDQSPEKNSQETALSDQTTISKSEIQPEKEKIAEAESKDSISPSYSNQSSKAEEEVKAQEKINKWLADAEEKAPKKDEAKSEPLKLGVFVTPQSTSSSTQAVNLGAGVITELPVSNKFKIDLGIAYARQNLSPGVAEYSNVMVAQSLSYSDRSAMMSSNFITTSNELSFGQLEIPFNLKYKVLENKKSDLYLISGVSNMLYLNQRNTVTYNAVNFANSGLVGAQTELRTISQTFTPDSQSLSNNTSIGQLLNLSVGYEQSLSNGTFISVEPFYKLSIGNQTFINQQFSIGGINLRMNFQLKDKK
ncbi:cell envelope integrity protein TolA [Arthrospiribacter ruber]|uniref:Outer membrane protein beta-barrel domain-containing protein n=1 Tax=Arthrospiribacter ruber TaxID=2487934 RepID=A0A951IX45_9BACT|nr:cell envelope integrity protein TolA [Arthrospiribacter ruber]MBW3468770.1 hypothetical protein [Arthrospiribacter ruber]